MGEPHRYALYVMYLEVKIDHTHSFTHTYIYIASCIRYDEHCFPSATTEAPCFLPLRERKEYAGCLIVIVTLTECTLIIAEG